MFDTWSKNNEQKCRADLHTRLHPGLFLSDLLCDNHTTSNIRFCFCHDALWQGAGNTDKGKHLKPTSHTNTLFSTTTKPTKKKTNTENMVMLFTQLSLICLDLNYKHTSILSTARFSDLQCPFGSLFTTLQNLALVPTVLKWIYRVAVW